MSKDKHPIPVPKFQNEQMREIALASAEDYLKLLARKEEELRQAFRETEGAVTISHSLKVDSAEGKMSDAVSFSLKRKASCEREIPDPDQGQLFDHDGNPIQWDPPAAGGPDDGVTDAEITDVKTVGEDRQLPGGETKALPGPSVEEHRKQKKEQVDAELAKQAIQIIKETRRATLSILQRRLHIGQNRASRIMDRLEENGIVGPANGNEPREILLALDPAADTESEEGS